MIEYKIKKENGVWFDKTAEIKVTEIIKDIITFSNYKVYAYNVCKDHIHLLIEAGDNKINNIVRHIKGKSSQAYKEYLSVSGKEPFRLWAQKFNKWFIESEEQLRNTSEYIMNNRLKHGLEENEELRTVILSMIDS